MILNKRFQKNLQAELDARNWSQSDLAREMGVNPQYVSKYLRGESKPGLDVIERFSLALGIADPVKMLSNSQRQEKKLENGSMVS